MTLLPDNLLPAGWEALRGVRAAAIEACRSTPMPSSELEDWRYSRIDDLDLDNLRLVDGSDAALSVDAAHMLEGIPANVQPILAELEDCEARLRIARGGTAEMWSASDAVTISADAGYTGIEADDLPALLEKDAFTALNLALSAVTHSVTIHEDSHIARPVVIIDSGTADGEFATPRVHVDVGARATATVVHVVATPPGRQVLVPVTNIDVGAGANVRVITLHLLTEWAWVMHRIVGDVAKDATAKITAVSLGGDYSRFRLDSTLSGEGSSLVNRGLYMGSERSMHDFRVHQRHVGASSTSQLILRGAVRDRSEGVFTGVVRMENGCRKASGAQDARHLILEDGAHVDSIPSLEIEENDVSCSHASSISPVDSDQIFYLESRGVPTDAATRLIARGFLRDGLAGVNAAGLSGVMERRVNDDLKRDLEPLIR